MAGVLPDLLIAVAITQAAATASPETPSHQVADVVVTAERPATVEQIDRTVHDVKGDPLAQTASLLDILGKLPSVTVTPNGRVSLLGSGVKVLIDGKPPLNNQALKSMLGSEVDRIEVMTNPSARYGSDGAGGIIDIRTRKRFKPGLTGSISTAADSDGAGQITVAPTWTFGKWTVGGSLTVNHDASWSERRQSRQILAPAALASIVTQDARSKSMDDGAAGKVRVAYKPSDRQTLTLSAQALTSSNQSRDEIRFTSSDPAVGSYVQRETAPGRFKGGDLDLSYEWTGRAEGETLAIEASRSSFVWNSSGRVDQTYANPALPVGRLRNVWRDDSDETTVKLDYQRPLAAKRLLSLGASWLRSDKTIDQVSETLVRVGRPWPDYNNRLEGSSDTNAAYATFQFVLGPWTLLPGARLEAWRADFLSAGEAVVRRDNGVTKSLHASRDLAGGAKLKLSYAERLSRPGLQTLDPSVRYYEVDSAWSGNPDLKSSITRAFEVHADKTIRKQTVGLTLYDRETERAWATVTQLTAAGVSLSTTINAGKSASRGAELSLRSPGSATWRYSATGNLYQSQRQVLEDGRLATNSQVRYSGNVQLDYKASAKAGRTPDQIQLALRYDSPQRAFQGKSSSAPKADFTWRHTLAARVAGVLTVTDILDASRFRSHLETPELIEDVLSRGSGRQFRLSLTYRIGGSK